jgi:hypothetical protein
MRAYAAGLCLCLFLAVSGAWAQNAPQPQLVSATNRVPDATSPDFTAVYCSGFVTDEKVSNETYLISGEDSRIKVIFGRGDYVYVNKGSAQGLHVGDRFSVVRPVSDDVKMQWFKWQDKLSKAMGTAYVDAGQIKIVNVQPNVSTAIVTQSCDYIQRGDLLLPYQDRPSPPYKPAGKFDHFAPVSGKSVGMIVFGPLFTQTYGTNSTAYVNLGTNQGVKVGDYLRIFRYQGSLAELAYNTKGYQYELFGVGSTPRRFEWNDLPREVVGEGVVLNVSRNSCTIYVTYTTLDAYAGDYVEIE